jgi:hypothetical protein
MSPGLGARLAAVALAVVSAGAPASSDAGPPTDQLKVSVEQIVKVLEDPALRPEARLSERRAAIR